MNQQKIGKGMIAAAWLIFLGAFALYFGFVQSGRDNPNQNPESMVDAEKITVRLQGTSQGHYVATGTINNQKVDFLVDTGATYVAIPERMADSLSLARGRQTTVSTANGNSRAWHTTIKKITLGKIKLTDVKALITPGLKNDILLGMSFLRQLKFTQEGNELILEQYRY